MTNKIFWGICYTCLIFLILPFKVLAAPYFSVTGPTTVHRPYSYAYKIWLFPDNTSINAAQVVLNFDSLVFSPQSLNTLNSKCAFYSPADPSLGFGSLATPYFYNDSKAVLTCGFHPLATEEVTGGGVFLGTVVLSPITETDTTSTLTLTDTLYKYIGNPVLGGINQNLDLAVFHATAAANPTATPYPSPTPVNPRTVTSADLTFVEIGTGSGTSGPATISANSNNPVTSDILNSVLDDSIPTPGPLTGRPTLAPWKAMIASSSAGGDILSLRSLRELLIPGKTSADKTVVMINLFTTFVFMAIITALIWWLYRTNRKNKTKLNYFKQVVEGEIAMIIGKTGNKNVLDPETRQDFEKKLKDLEGGPS